MPVQAALGAAAVAVAAAVVAAAAAVSAAEAEFGVVMLEADIRVPPGFEACSSLMTL
jgi:hypothetical protein